VENQDRYGQNTFYRWVVCKLIIIKRLIGGGDSGASGNARLTWFGKERLKNVI
jgi:hypothetical protein